MANNDLSDYQQSRSSSNQDINNSNSSSDICSISPINIDHASNESNANVEIEPKTSTSNDILGFTSTWQRKSTTNDEHDDGHTTTTATTTTSNVIQFIFTIPYVISNQTIRNKTVFIIDALHNQLLASLTDICINESSFIINYSTSKSLPHTICLYLLLGIKTATTVREIIFCRTIDDLYIDSSASQNQTESTHAVGPSEFFIVSQCIIIFLMMFIIYAVQTARQKSLVNRFSERLTRSRPYIILFGRKTPTRTDSDRSATQINPSRTLQSGLNNLVFHRHVAAIPNHQMHAPIDEQILAANDLTLTLYDRKVSKPFINRDLIDVKEFTKRMSTQIDTLADTELHAV